MMDLSTSKTGKDLRKALDSGCVENCRECALKTSENRCLLKVKEQWQTWADEEHKKFGRLLDDRNIGDS